MGLFGLFKKNGTQTDKSVVPRCGYCEYGKPAKSEGRILCPKCGIVSADFSCKKFVYSPSHRILENARNAEMSKTETVLIKASLSGNAENIPVPEKAESIPEKREPVPEKAEKRAEAKESGISDIHLTPKDNSDNIRRLESMEKTVVGEIENHTAPKEIKLPEVSESSVSSIENTPVKRNSEEYLKSVSVQTVSDFENTGHTVHTLPEGIQKPLLSEVGDPTGRFSEKST